MQLKISLVPIVSQEREPQVRIQDFRKGGGTGKWLEHYVKQQLFQSLPLHTGPSLNCPGETAELWQSELSWPLVRT